MWPFPKTLQVFSLEIMVSMERLSHGNRRRAQVLHSSWLRKKRVVYNRNPLTQEILWSLKASIRHGTRGSDNLWWLILCVNLTRLRDAQIADKTLLPGVPVRMSPEEMNIWISRMSKEDLHQCQWASSNTLSTWIEQKRQRKDKFAL